MDRDLAIKVIKRMIKTGIAYDDGYAYEPLTNDEKEALDMAIKALEQCEVWNGIHGQVVAPKGTFDRIWNDADKEEQEPQTGQKKNCNNCKYGYLSLVCKKPNTEICGNNFSQWKPYEESEEI